MRIELDDLTRPAIHALLNEHLQNMYALSPPESVHALDLDELRRPNVTFWSAWDGDTLLGCAALKELDPAHGEIKSMRTPTALRRRGAGRRLLEHVVAVARSRGYARLSLETGSMDAFAPAHRLYTSFGFTACGPFGDYVEDPHSVFMTLSLQRHRLRMHKLHQMHVSGNCYKVRLAAHQLGVALQLVDYGLLDGTTRQPEYLARNPNGRVPMLELDDGRFLPESGAILWYLAEGTPLLPEDRWGRAEALQWMFFEQYSHEPYVAVARFWLKFAPPAELEKRQHLVPEWHAKGNAALGVMEAHLAQHDWFASGRYSIADIALYGYTHSAADGGFDLARYPAVGRWLARVRSQPAHVPLEFRG